MSNTDFLQLRKDCEDFVKICGTFDKFDKADSLLPKHSKILIIGVSLWVYIYIYIYVYMYIYTYMYVTWKAMDLYL